MSNREGMSTQLIVALVLAGVFFLMLIGGFFAVTLYYGFNPIEGNESKETYSRPFRSVHSSPEWEAHQRWEKKRIKRLRKEAQKAPVKVARQEVDSDLSIGEALENPAELDNRWVTFEGTLIYPHWQPGDLTEKGNPSLVSTSDYEEQGRDVSLDRQIDLVDYPEELERPEGSRVRVTGKLLIADRGTSGTMRLNSREQLERIRQGARKYAEEHGEELKDTTHVLKEEDGEIVVANGHDWEYFLSVKSYRVLEETEREPSVQLSEEEMTPEEFEPEVSAKWSRTVLDKGHFTKDVNPAFTEFGDGDVGLVWTRREQNKHAVKYTRFRTQGALENVPITTVRTSPEEFTRIDLTGRGNRPLILLESSATEGVLLATTGASDTPARADWELRQLAGEHHFGGDVATAGDGVMGCSVSSDTEAGYFHYSAQGIPESPSNWRTHKVISRDEERLFTGVDFTSGCQIGIYRGRPVLVMSSSNRARSYALFPRTELPERTEDWDREGMHGHPALLTGSTEVPMFLEQTSEAVITYPESLSPPGNWNEHRVSKGELWHRGTYIESPREFRLAWAQRVNQSENNQVRFRGQLVVSEVSGPPEKRSSWKYQVIDEGFKNREWSLRLGEESDLIRAGGRTLLAYLRCAYRNQIKERGPMYGGGKYEAVDYSDCELVVARN